MKKFRWSKVYESSEEELVDHLAGRNILATRFAAELGSDPVQHPATTDSTIWCAEGSLSIQSGSASMSLQPGDGVTISADTAYELRAGLTGYVCYSAA